MASQEEIFDVVNERDEVVSSAPRSEVHARNLLHRAVHVLVFNERGELFLQKRSRRKDCFPGVWDSSASGHVDRGESYDACAVREVQEELGWLPPGAPEKLFKIGASAATGHEFVWLYQVAGGGPFELHPEEIETGGWFEPRHVDAWTRESPGDFADAFPVVWSAYRERGCQPPS